MIKPITTWLLLAGAGLLALVAPPRATAQIFQEVLVDSLLSTPPPVWFGEAGWADYDGDGDYDLMLTGNVQPSQNAEPFSQLFFNDGDVVMPVPNPPSDEPILVPVSKYSDALNRNSPVLLDVWQSAVAWADYDGDGDLDVAVSGLLDDGGHSLRIYENIDDAERFALGFDTPGLRSGDLAWGDVDNDGDYDLLACGTNQNNQPSTTLYHNQTTATASFVPQPGTGLDHLDACSADFGDYDGDGDQDLLLTGTTAQQAFLTRIYRNDGGSFTAVGAGLKGLVFATGSWGDYDADGDLDVLVSGGRLTPFMLEGQIKVYRNDGGSVFTDVSDGLVGAFENDATPGRYQGGAGWGDFDNDGILDFLITGAESLRGSNRGQVYRTAPGDRFARRTDERFDGGLFGDAFWGDYDGDRDLDFFVIGEDPSLGLVIQAWRNEFFFDNTPPSAPSGLQATPQTSTVTLSWNPASDAQTPTPGLGYNLRVGTTPGASDVVSPMALDSGRRLLSRRGNVDHALRWRLRGLAPGTYYWSVQALDNSYAGSAFAPEASFTIDG